MKENTQNKIDIKALRESGVSEEDLKILEKSLKGIEAESKRLEKYKTENKIFFFTPPPKDYVVPTTREAISLVKDRYHNPKQLEAFSVWKDKKVKKLCFIGANRTSKTTTGTAIGISALLGYYPWEGESSYLNETPSKVLLVGQQWEEHIRKVLVKKWQDWWPKKIEIKTKNNTQGVPSEWTLNNGSLLCIMSNYQDRKAFEGSDWDVIIWDEPPTEENYIAASRGLIDRGGRQLFMMTLLGEQSWIDRKIIKGLDDEGRPDPGVYVIHSVMRDNKGYGLLEEDILEFEKQLPEEERQARIYGIPSYLSGLVLPTFNRKTHIIQQPFKIPLDWPVDIALDLHPRERQAVLFRTTDPKGNRYYFDEIWEHGSGKEIAWEIVRRIRRQELRVNDIIIDPLTKADSNNEKTVYDSVDDVLRAYGYPLRVACKDKHQGIMKIKEELKSLNNLPSAFLFSTLKRTIFEAEGWVYDKDTQKPIDKDDHMMENWYRLALIDTQWSYMEVPTIGESIENDFNSNKITGY